MKIIIVVLTLTFISSCKELNDKDSNSERIKGDWAISSFNDGRLVFSFGDSTCSYLYPHGEFSKYSISADTLLINESFDEYEAFFKDEEEKENYTFKIISVTDDSLKIRPLTSETNALFEKFEQFDSGTIVLGRIQKKNDVQVERISFYSSGCYAGCPVMYLEIDSDRNILFDDRVARFPFDHYPEEGELYSGKISKADFQQLIRKIHAIELDSLNEWYEAYYTHAQTLGVKIQTAHKEYKSNAYGFSEEPIELRMLLHFLMEIRHRVELKEDFTIERPLSFGTYDDAFSRVEQAAD